MRTNNDRLAQGAAPVPVSIWGTHGIGKTELVEQIAQQRLHAPTQGQ